MALTQFVRNVQDLSDDGGYKFRFHCDRCNDGVESHYISSSANVLKTGLQVFQALRFWSWGSSAVDGIDRGLRGKERDAAYERAAAEAISHFTKCSHCGSWVDAHCWNATAGLCEGCAPDSSEAAAIAAAERRRTAVTQAASIGEVTPGQITCVVCGQATGGGKFCMSCGAPAASSACSRCGASLPPGAKFCGGCGQPA